jgi:hypothetical protein
MIQHYVKADTVDGDIEVSASTIDGKQIPLKDVREAFAAYSFVAFRLNYLAGKILTQCDASFSDPVQRKAVKDTFRQYIADEFGLYGEMLQRGIIEDAMNDIENMSEKNFKRWQRQHPGVDISEVIAPGK